MGRNEKAEINKGGGGGDGAKQRKISRGGEGNPPPPSSIVSLRSKRWMDANGLSSAGRRFFGMH